MFIEMAWAQDAASGTPSVLAGLGQFLPLVLIFGVFYFFMIRPQMRKAKEHRSMVEALKRGDRVLTNGGIIGQVTKVADNNEVQVEIAEGVKVRVQKMAISQVLSRGTSDSADSKKE